MSELTNSQRQELYRKLLSLQSELKALLRNSSDGSKPVSLDEPIGRLSRMDALQQQEMIVANRATARIRLERIHAALQRFKTAEYGLCLSCEEPIDHARLEAFPEAVFCIACQTIRESQGS